MTSSKNIQSQSAIDKNKKLREKISQDEIDRVVQLYKEGKVSFVRNYPFCSSCHGRVWHQYIGDIDKTAEWKTLCLECGDITYS